MGLEEKKYYKRIQTIRVDSKNVQKFWWFLYLIFLPFMVLAYILYSNYEVGLVLLGLLLGLWLSAISVIKRDKQYKWYTILDTTIEEIDHEN